MDRLLMQLGSDYFTTESEAELHHELRTTPGITRDLMAALRRDYLNRPIPNPYTATLPLAALYFRSDLTAEDGQNQNQALSIL